MRNLLWLLALALVAGCAPVTQNVDQLFMSHSSMTWYYSASTQKVKNATEKPLGHPVAISESGKTCDLVGSLAAKWWNIQPGTMLNCWWH